MSPIDMRPNQTVYPKEVKVRARELFLGGKTASEIGQELNVPGQMVHVWAYRGNWNETKGLVLAGTKTTKESREVEGFYRLSQSVRLTLAKDLERVVRKLLASKVPGQAATLELRANIHQKLATAGEKLFGWKETDHGLISLGEMKCIDIATTKVD